MFYVDNNDAGYPQFSTAKEAVEASRQIGGKVWITGVFWSPELAAELAAAEEEK